MPGGSKKGGGLKTKQTYKKGYGSKSSKKKSNHGILKPKRKKVRSVGLR